MRTLIIPDVHHRIKIAQSIIDSEKADKVVHLGDHQDNFHDTPDHAIATAHWTLSRLEAGDTILLGNHDLQYAFPHPMHGCSGWTRDKAQFVTPMLHPIRSKFRLWDQVDGWTLSHAGFSSASLPWINRQDELLDLLMSGDTHWVIGGSGKIRGGIHKHPGVLWQDWTHEFKPVPNLKQIVGHTALPFPKQLGDNWCIDTHLQHYGIIEDGKFTVHEAPKSEFFM